MDKKILITNLRKLFCSTPELRNSYSSVWITDVDFGGLYKSNMYVLNVKAAYQLSSCHKEISSIIKLLDEKAFEELQLIWRVAVYNADDQRECYSSDIMIYSEACI